MTPLIKLCLESVRIFLTVLKTPSQNELLCEIRRRNLAKFDRFEKRDVSVAASSCAFDCRHFSFLVVLCYLYFDNQVANLPIFFVGITNGKREISVVK